MFETQVKLKVRTPSTKHWNSLLQPGIKGTDLDASWCNSDEDQNPMNCILWVVALVAVLTHDKVLTMFVLLHFLFIISHCSFLLKCKLNGISLFFFCGRSLIHSEPGWIYPESSNILSVSLKPPTSNCALFRQWCGLPEITVSSPLTCCCFIDQGNFTVLPGMNKSTCMWDQVCQSRG